MLANLYLRRLSKFKRNLLMGKQLNLARALAFKRAVTLFQHGVNKFIFWCLDKTVLVVFKKRAFFVFVSLKFYHGFS